MAEKKTKEQFVLEANKIHPYPYNYGYDDFVYINALKKGKIYCPRCNEYFWQTPNSHLCGSGCPKCGINKNKEKLSLGNDVFLEKANNIFGPNKYKYPNLNYKNNRTKIEIYCLKCNNTFFQTPHDHLSGQGCPYCAGKIITTQDVIKRFINVHGDKYGYGEVEYMGMYKKVKIFCNNCREYFWQIPHNHIHGEGCYKCGYKTVSQKNGYTEKEFISKAEEKFPGEFDYNNVKYINAFRHVIIHCNTCNRDFLQTPAMHLYGSGCPYCKKSKGERLICKILDLKNIKYEHQKRFKDCKSKRALPFDFYLPDYNLCIEYQGKQHYNPEFYDRFNMTKEKIEESFQDTQLHDQIKRDFCKNNGIKLLEIRYDEDIEKKLEEALILKS